MTDINLTASRFFPDLSAELPIGWAANASVTLISDDGSANVILSSEQVPPTVDSYEYANTVGRLLPYDLHRYHEEEFGPALIFGSRPGYVRVFRWTPPDGADVTQIQAYSAEDGRGFTATATTPTAIFPESEMQLRWVIGGLRIHPS